MKLLNDKVVLVTGAVRGIGKAIALTCAEHGAHIAFTDIADNQLLEKVAGEISALGVKSVGYNADASDFESACKVVDQIVETFGRIDVIINNAGITRDNLLLRMSEEQFDLVMKVNLKSVFNYTKAGIKQMIRQKSGSFINISSVVGVQGNAGQANYAASKAGIIGFTKSVAEELGSRNIRANAIAPGFIATEMTDAIPQEEIDRWLGSIPLKRAGTPRDVADLCVFLGSDLSTYITGQVLHVDGGMVM